LIAKDYPLQPEYINIYSSGSCRSSNARHWDSRRTQAIIASVGKPIYSSANGPV